MTCSGCALSLAWLSTSVVFPATLQTSGRKMVETVSVTPTSEVGVFSQGRFLPRPGVGSGPLCVPTLGHSDHTTGGTRDETETARPSEATRLLISVLGVAHRGIQAQGESVEAALSSWGDGV